MATRTYKPRPGTNAYRILQHIIDNPGCSVTSVYKKLGMNPSPARVCITSLRDADLIYDVIDDNGHHQLTAKGPEF